ncbi:NPCBM/NEW2 domain-containing protein [Deinococcus sp.]|uniref:NPCBM/NEW2 domain-containing protein n=1 Tax=Deinococcus sp. TaxID=47478 RepID=UPI003B5A69DE
MTHAPCSTALKRPLALLLGALTLAACSQPAPQGQSGTPTPDDPYLNAGDQSWTSPVSNGALTLDPGSNNLSFENWTSASNGWGPIERDRSNGEKNAGDGRTLTLAGKTYAKGFGVHASSSMTFNLAAKCSAFTSDIGIDDEVGNKGSAVFQVFADGSKIYDSGKLTGSSAIKSLKVDVTGKKELKLVVTDAGDGLSYDHADWAAPTLNCSGQTGGPLTLKSVTVKVPSGLNAAPFDQSRTLKVPDGYAVSVYARIDKARFMQPLPNGDLLVSQPSTGKVMLVKPGANGAGAVSTFTQGLKNPHDMVLHTIGSTTYLYLAESNRVTRSVYQSGDTTRKSVQTVVDNLPDASTAELKGSYAHGLKNIALDSNHKLYVSVASATNQNPSDVTAAFKRAAIYQYNADGSGRRLFAQGIRNAEGLAFAPGSNDLWVVVNNRDNIAYPFHNDWQNDGTGDDFGKVIQSYVDNHPPEEFIKVRDGGNSGWPYCNPNPDAGLNNMPFDRDVENNADGSKLDCAKADRITKGIQAHSAPLGLSFWQGSNAPASLKGGALAALHGCWNCSAFVGHKVIAFPWTAGGLPGQEQELVSGWVTNATSKIRWGRPVDVVPDASGNLLISDDFANAVYKLTPGN